MLFDVVCKVAERYCPEIFEMVKEAKIFTFDEGQKGVPPSSVKEEVESKRLGDLFFLPYQSVAVEDDYSCIICRDEEEDASGLKAIRRFIEITPAPDVGIFSGSKASFLVVYGCFENVRVQEEGDSQYRLGLSLRIDGLMMVHEKKQVEWFLRLDAKTHEPIVAHPFMLTPAVYQAVVNDARNNLAIFLHQIAFFNSPKRFIVEEQRPLKGKQQYNQKRLLRAYQRPQYTLLEPTAIRKLFRFSEAKKGQGEGTPKGAHIRRRHRRFLSSKRFVNCQGKTIIIPAQWIGPSEVEVGRKRYKVVLDK